jgi:hypothetical protein
MNTPTAETWYAPTAYTADKKKDLLPPEPSAWKGAERVWRAFPLHNGVYCGEYRQGVFSGDIEALNNEGRVDPTWDHERLDLFTGANPRYLFALMKFVGGMFAFVGLISLFGLVSFPPNDAEEAYCYLYFLVPLVVFFLGLLGVKYAPDKNNIILNRRTGMVLFERKKKEVPFAEIDGYYWAAQNPVGWKYQLQMGHRYLPLGFGDFIEDVERSWVQARWEFYQQYMDIKMPLPDVPAFEPFRHLDPTTAAYDMEHNRPPHYWRDMTEEQVRKEINLGAKIVEKFPWHTLPVNEVPQECMDRLRLGARMIK